MTCPPFTVTAISSSATTSPSFNLQPSRRQRQDKKTIPSRWGRSTRWHDDLSLLKLTPIRAANANNATGGGGRNRNAAFRGRGNNNIINNNNISFPPPSPALSDVIQELYSSLNDKDMKRLEKLTTPDCTIHDTAYYTPLDAKSTHAYFKRLMEAMGKNVRFVIDEVCQGGVGVERQPTTAAVMWHLEWKGKMIPFTNGCSFFVCSANNGAAAAAALVIRKIHIFDESPLKPGKLALETLNFVTNLLDTFPNIAEGFLKKPDALVQPCVRFFRFFLEPIIFPIVAYYTRFWTCVARALAMLLNVLYNIYIFIFGRIMN